MNSAQARHTEPHEREHTSVNARARPDSSDIRAYVETLPRSPESASRARRLVSDALGSWGIPGIAHDDAVLIISEIVSNATQHVRAGEIDVVITRLDDVVVRLAAADKSSVLPRLRAPHADELRGRGLRLVDELSARWGTDPLPGGKRVWAELRGRKP
ncbi:ATP-binding protein [Streptomyces sp. PmtG]